AQAWRPELQVLGEEVEVGGLCCGGSGDDSNSGVNVFGHRRQADFRAAGLVADFHDDGDLQGHAARDRLVGGEGGGSNHVLGGGRLRKRGEQEKEKGNEDGDKEVFHTVT